MSPRKQPAVRQAPQTRLRWWGIALPVVAFVALLSLLASPAAQAGETGAGSHPVLLQIADLLPQILLGLIG